MQTWVIIVVSLLSIAIVILSIITYLYQRANNQSNQHNILYPFSASIQPGDSTVFLKNAAGNSQIDCSAVGGKINIVGAWSEVIDPFGECANSSSSALNLSCGVQGQKIACKEDSDCGSGMQCAGGLCKPALCPLDPSKGIGRFDSSKCSCGGNYCPIRPGTPFAGSNNCNDPQGILMYHNTNTNTCEVNPGQSCMAPDITGQFCALYPLCSNISVIDGNVVNNVCNPANNGSQGQPICRPRDASAYLAAKCDGKSTCVLEYDPENIKSGFGPRPCDGQVKTNIGIGSEYGQLPNIPSAGGSYQKGYVTHGIYTCELPG